MAIEFRLPDIGEGVVEGEIVRWLVTEGDTLREDQPMVEVMTDKATVEIPTPKAGRVARILVPQGKICAVGQVMVVIEPAGTAAVSSGHAAAPVAAPPAPATSAPAAAPLPAAPVSAAPAAPTFQTKVLATPATRQLARTLNIDIRTVAGTGPGGRITREDVQRAYGQGDSAHPAASPAPTAPAASVAPAAPTAPATPTAPAAVAPLALGAGDDRIAFRGVRKKIADNMLRSTQSAAHFTYVEECDVTELIAIRDRAQKRAGERGIKLTYLPFIIKAVVSGLKKYPIVNATLDVAREEIILRKSYHIGVATATQSGLIVPVLRDADKLSLYQIAETVGPLAERARTGKASREELVGSTFTITSLGKLGGVLATPIINFPEVAIMGVHKIKEVPAVRDGQIVIRQVMNLSISLDHRIVDGYEGAMFLQHVVSLLEDPTQLFMELV
jgi:pyruvate dehydrogenase E2 component (dihydrolipoamide acetyltransferase)